MKIRDLTIIPLCLALLPCSAQEEPVPPADRASIAMEEAEADTMVKLLEDTLVKAAALLQLLDSVENAADADSKAPKAAERCLELLGYRLAVRKHVRDGEIPDSDERLQKLGEAINRILQSDTHRSDALKQALSGLEYAESLVAEGKDTKPLETYISKHEDFVDYCSLLVDFLQEIEDKDRADALAAPNQFRNMFISIRRTKAALAELGKMVDVGVCEAWLKLAQGSTAKEAEEQLRQAIAACAATEPPYFGSERLQELLGRLDTPVTEQEEMEEDELLQTSTPPAEDVPARDFTPEEEQHARAMLDIRLQIYVELKGIIYGIKDKATADAAVPALIALDEKMREHTEDFDKWMDERGLPDAVHDLYLAEYKAKEKPAVEASELQMLRLGLLDDAYYGSADLAQLFGGQQGDGEEPEMADESTPEEKEEVRQVFNRYLAVTDEIRRLIISVVDKETADAAAPRLEVLLEERARKDKKVEVLLEGNERLMAAAYAILPEYRAKFEQLNNLDTYIRLGLLLLDQPCFGSEALQKVLSTPRHQPREETEE